MRVWHRFLLYCIASLALCFATETALPAKAYAEIIDLADGYASLQFKCLAMDTEPISSEITANDAYDVFKTTVGKSNGELDATNTGYEAGSIGGTFSIAGTVSQNNGATALSGTYTDNSNDISIDTAGYINTQYELNELYRSDVMSLTGIPSRPYCMLILRLGNDAMKTGDLFRIVIPATCEWEYSNNGSAWSSKRSSLANVTVWAANNASVNRAVKLSQNSTGFFECTDTTSIVYIVFRLNSTAITTTNLNSPYSRFRFYNPFRVLLYVTDKDIENLSTQTIMNTQNITNTVSQQTQQQTNALKDTTGSDSVISGTDGVNQQIQSKLGFIAETATITSNLYDAILYEGDGYVPFPEIAWEGQTIIAAQNVPILGYIPSIEDDIKTFNTIVLFLAWLHGMHSLYARIFLGQVEVISEDD